MELHTTIECGRIFLGIVLVVLVLVFLRMIAERK
jgi:hypothetical protein